MTVWLYLFHILNLAFIFPNFHFIDFEKYDRVDRTMKRDNSNTSNFINTKFKDYDKSLSQAFPSKETIDSQRSNSKLSG